MSNTAQKFHFCLVSFAHGEVVKKALVQGLTQYEVDDIIKECAGNLRYIIKKINLGLLTLKKNFDFRTEDEDVQYNENFTLFKP